MSETVVFIIGAIIWAITVAGVVIAGGHLLGRDPRARRERADPRPSDSEG